MLYKYSIKICTMQIFNNFLLTLWVTSIKYGYD